MTPHEAQTHRNPPDMATRQITDLLTAKASLWRTVDLSDLMQSAIEAAARTSGFETGAIYLLDDNVLYLGATTPPLPPDFPNALRFANAIDHPHIMHALDTESPILVADLETEPLSPAEREATEVRGLKSILYVPLFAGDRPSGVFMLGSTTKARHVGERELIISQTLAHSIALALEEADLFETLMTSARDRSRHVQERLAELARVAASRETCEMSELAGELQLRLQHRLTLLEICDELLAEGPLVGARSDDSALTCGLELKTALEESRAFAHAEGLEFGLKAALDFLASRVGIGPTEDRIRVDDLTQMTDPDTTLLLYRSAKEILEETARHDRAHADAVMLSVDDPDHVVMKVMADKRLCEALADSDGRQGRLCALRDRLRRAAGDLALEESGDRCEATVMLPYFRHAS